MATGNAIQGATGPASPPSGAAGGDLSGTYPNPSVAKIGGVAISGTPAANSVLVASGATAAAWVAGQALQATTGVGGFALQNATPTIITWTPPNDGLLHRVTLFLAPVITSSSTGGQVNLNFTDPTGGARSIVVATPTHGAGYLTPVGPVTYMVQAGQAVSLVQSTALTGGAVTVFSELWGS
jgi:hypothetical protein